MQIDFVRELDNRKEEIGYRALLEAVFAPINDSEIHYTHGYWSVGMARTKGLIPHWVGFCKQCQHFFLICGPKQSRCYCIDHKEH